MAYIPQHLADVFVSYANDDDYAWIERFTLDLQTALSRKLRARIKPEIFFDSQSLRAGRVFDQEIADCLARTGFFLAMISNRYNSSEYCVQEELPAFSRHHPLDSGRLIQAWLDLRAKLQLEQLGAVKFADDKGLFRSGTSAYDDALRRVYEPIVTELDKLYANSKLVFLAWPSDPTLQKERKSLKSEIEGRGLRIYPEAVGPLAEDARLREALEQSTTSVHFFGATPDEFDLRQWDAAVRLGKPCVLASRDGTEKRRGPAGSPWPIYLDQGSPIAAIAKAIEELAGIRKRDDREAQSSLGRKSVLLIFEPGSDGILGLKLRKRIRSKGPFDVIVPDTDDQSRYSNLTQAQLALLCRAKASTGWLENELEALGNAMAKSRLFDLPRILMVPRDSDAGSLELFDTDKVVHSEDDLDKALTLVRVAEP